MAAQFQDITELIRIKENELHDIHDLRCDKLEKMVEERDKLLLESGRRFEQLKDDFQYNLSLLDARDKEIRRLSTVLEERHKTVLDNEATIRKVSVQLDLQTQRANEQLEKHNQDKAASKQILQELKDVVASMQWASAEESRIQKRNIDAMRDEIQRQCASREDALNEQRKDLTSTFEQLIRQREDAVNVKEREIGNQISQFEMKFERVQTENSRLNSELADNLRRNDMLTDEAARREETIRQLHWKFEDEKSNKQQSIDTLQRRIQQLTVELATSREAHVQDEALQLHKLSEMSAEASRELEIRNVLEKRLSEAGTQQSSCERQLLDLRQQLDKSHVDKDQLREERDAAVERASISKLHSEGASSQLALLSVDLDTARQELQATRARLIESDGKLSAAEVATRIAQEATVASGQQLQRLADERVTACRQTMTEATHTMEEAMTIRIQQTQRTLQHEIESLQQDGNMKKIEYEIKLAALEADNDSLTNALKEIRQLLEDEQTACAALKLRFRLQESQLQSFQQQFQQMQGAARHAVSSTSASGLSHNNSSNKDHASYQERTEHLQQSAAQPSPMFSEDFGSVSLPMSPLQMSYNFPAEDTVTAQFRGHAAQDQQSLNYDARHLRHSEEDDHSVPSSAFINSLQHQESAEKLENARLKAIIREMREDIESLQGQTESRMSGGAGAGDDRKLTALETRLEQTVGEVGRLRAERTRLMDVGNQLRSALNKATSAAAPLGGVDRQDVFFAAREAAGHPSPVKPVAASSLANSRNPWEESVAGPQNRLPIPVERDDFIATGRQIASNLGSGSRSARGAGVRVVKKSLTGAIATVSGTSHARLHPPLPRKVMNYAHHSPDEE